MRRSRPRGRRWLAVAGSASAALAIACSTLVGIDDPRERSEDAGRIAIDAWVGDALTLVESGSQATESGADDGGSLLEPEAGDAGLACAPPPDDTMGVFVDGSAGHDAVDCGTRQAACATIGQGVLRAQAVSKPFVYVAAGAYFGPVSLAAGVTIQGGWAAQGTAWTAVCPPQSQGAVTISGSPQVRGHHSGAGRRRDCAAPDADRAEQGREQHRCGRDGLWDHGDRVHDEPGSEGCDCRDRERRRGRERRHGRGR